VLTEALQLKDPYSYQTFATVLNEHKGIQNLFLQYWLHLVAIIQSKLKELTTYDNYVTAYPALANLFGEFWNGL
jgi:hypothetical protein